MANDGNVGAAAGTANTGGQVASAQPAGDVVSIPRSEYETYVRNNERLKGSDAFYNKAKEFGFKSAEDFDRFKPTYETLTNLEKRGIKSDMLSRMFSGEADADLRSEQNQQPQFDPKKYRDEVMSEVRREIALKEWDDMSKREKEHVDAALRDILGDDQVDEMTKTTYRMAVERHLDSLREMYPKDHPLHSDRLQPISESHAKKAAEWFKAEKAKYAGEAMKSKAEAANKNKGRVTSAAGATPGQGGAKSEERKQSVRGEVDDMVANIISTKR